MRRSSPCARLVLLMHSLERADNWRTMIGNYTRQRSVCSILIIWNNVNATMPAVLRSAVGGKTRVLAARQNSLTNRYTLLPSVTDPVLFADDDLILDASLVQRMLRAHAMNPSRVIGADCRCADSTGAYTRPTSNQAEVRPNGLLDPRCNVANGRTMLFHPQHLPLFSAAYRRIVDDPLHPCFMCDDLVFNALVSKHTRQLPLMVERTKKSRIELSGKGGLSVEMDAWLRHRSACVLHLTAALGDVWLQTAVSSRLSPSKASKFTCPKVEPKPKRKKSRPTQPGSNLRSSKRWFGIKHIFAILMAVTVLVLSVIAWRATEETGTADGQIYETPFGQNQRSVSYKVSRSPA